MKVMAQGLTGDTSFMEDYTYHLDPGGPLVLGSHMLEVCPSVAHGQARPRRFTRSASAGKEDPVRLVFDDRSPGPAINAALMDLGNRFRLLVGEVDAVAPAAAACRSCPSPAPCLVAAGPRFHDRLRRLDSCGRRRPSHRL